MTESKEQTTDAATEAGAAAGSEADVEPQGTGETVQEPPGADKLARVREELSQTKDRHLRLAAEFDNYRKRIERERTELYVRAQAELVARLLDALDDLQRVADHAEAADAQTLLDGVQLVEKKMLQVLESSGLEVVDASGEIFDPATMEALGTVAAESAEEDDRVADVFQRGYRYKGQLIRPARVRVKQFEA